MKLGLIIEVGVAHLIDASFIDEMSKRAWVVTSKVLTLENGCLKHSGGKKSENDNSK